MIGMLELLKVDKAYNYTCGSASLNMPGMLPYIISTIVLIIEIVVPVLLIVFGMIDLGKAVIAQKEDEIKKGQSTFFKRLIAAILVFFVIFIVKLVIGFVSNDNTTLSNCINCFINGTESSDSCVRLGSSNNTGSL